MLEAFIEKISSYNFLNCLIPGVLVTYCADCMFSITLLTDDWFNDFFIIFIYGLISSRIGSLIVEPFLKKIKFIKYAKYDAFCNAEKEDKKICVLLEMNNLYRTLIGAFILLVFICGMNFLRLKIEFINTYFNCIILTLLLILFVFSYKKQTNYIKNRVEILQKK